MRTIPLNRRFVEWRDEAVEPSALWWRFALSDSLLKWSDLQARRRVVLLAEAGSGKTVELAYQAKQLSADGKFAFYATVQDVGHEGLDGALRSIDQKRLYTWRESDQPAWFFIDSIDEAKLDNIRLDKALRQLANGIDGQEHRAFIVLSGRYTDWEFARDARRFHDELPVPSDEPEKPSPSLKTLIHRLLSHERESKTSPRETLLVALMAPLDDEQVRVYLKAKGISKIDGFLEAIQSGNLQDIVRRPLDLDWLVQYWRTHGRLGSFEDILDSSLRERIREVNRDRSRLDNLDEERAMRGLERIGASLVFGRKATIAIPDTDAPPSADQNVLTIEAVLPDWTNSQQQLLLNRPAFDPSTLGRARLHNDNEGVVRGFLAARWLLRLHNANLPERKLHSLLFAQSYGIDLVRPSLKETAAWLSLWNESIAQEVVRRDPFLLLNSGDPSSLPASTRAAVLQALVTRIRRGEETPFLDLSSVTRFAQQDIAPIVRILWMSDSQHAEIRVLLLRLIWLGALRDCTELAAGAAYGRFQDQSTLIMAGRALIATSDANRRRNYADYVKHHQLTLPPVVIWEAIESLFPAYIGVEDFIKICSVIIGPPKVEEGFGIEWGGAALAEKLHDANSLTQLIRGLLKLDENGLFPDRDGNLEQFSAIGPILSAAAEQLLKIEPSDTAPEAAIDAILYLRARENYYANKLRGKTQDVISKLNETPERRRTTFWRAVDCLSRSNVLNGRGLLSTGQMQFLGWPAGLVTEDIDWLLADGLLRKSGDEQRLAANAALELWDKAGKPELVLARIKTAAQASAAMSAAISDWLQSVNRSAELRRSEARYQEVVAEGKRRQEEREQSWFDFVNSLRNDSEPLSAVNPTTAKGVDNRLYHLWQLLSQADGKKAGSRHASDDVTPLIELVGDKATKAFTACMRQMWRAWRPTLRSERPPKVRNQISQNDCMGLSAVSIEAANDLAWATKLTEAEAVRAAEYATLEINGLPNWVTDLAAAWPEAVKHVLAAEIVSDLNNPEPSAYWALLDYIDRDEQRPVAALMAQPLWHELQSRAELHPGALQRITSILRQHLTAEQKPQAFKLAIMRFNATDDSQVAALYLGLACTIDPQAATDSLIEKLKVLDEAKKVMLAQWVLPQIFGSRFSRNTGGSIDLDLGTLERLVILAYKNVRVAEDHNHANGTVYTPDQRDFAEGARSAAFNRLVRTPGHPTFDAILRLIEIPDFPVPRSRLLALAHERAATDSELTPWNGGDAVEYEQQFERVPTTGRELQQLLIQRFADLQHELVHGDFFQGTTLSDLPDETKVQRWIADRMRVMQGASYSVEREPETVAAKKPDVVFTARSSTVKVPTEIKVAESWSLADLKHALEHQLCRKYLRDRDCREGLLVLVHQRSRPKGWKFPDGRYHTFAELVQRLHNFAAQIRRKSFEGPQPELVVIDVSGCAKFEQK